MPVPRIYHPETLRTGETVLVTGSAANHLSRVLRLKPGDVVILFHDDGHDYTARIDRPAAGGLNISVGESRPANTESALRVILMQGICRGQKMDLVVQKATELGVSAILPLSCERSVVRIAGERAARRREHWFGVATGAAEQCGRALVPQIYPPLSFPAAVAELPADSTRLLLDPDSPTSLGVTRPDANAIVLMAGPEGGLTQAERQAAHDAAFTGVRLGPRILRTETAPLAALSVVQFLYGDLGD